MKKSIFIAISIFTLMGLVLFSGCSKNYLDLPVEGVVPSTYQKTVTADQAFQYVSACYAGFRKYGVSVFAYIGMFEIASDDADKGSTESDNPAMAELDKFTCQPNNEHISSFWNDHYTVISNCNYAINVLQKMNFADTTARNQLIAETKFIRAFLYLQLNLAYGGVPLTDTTKSADEFSKIPRSTAQQVYQFIEKDLNYAIKYLPETYSYEQTGRATVGAAEALLARTCMYEEKWDQVKALTDKIIASDVYSLYPDFYRMFRVEGENCSESIFELQLTSMDQGKYRCEYGFDQGPRNNFAKLQGWGFCTPSTKLINFFENRNDLVRKAATILYRGSRTKEGDSIDAKCPNPAYNYKVYEQLKYNTVDYALDHNIRFIRYAEVLLMNAEAKLHVGGDAATPLNEVRARAKLDPIGSPTLQDVWDERRAEFALEEFRFFDLVRTKQSVKELGALGFKSGKNEVFPIPQTQIDLSNGVLIQNPGY
ncbi:MAG: RagB/SusD family nutrient uptake outer membrane protein [Bacteroidota bacterium]|nr:RagB/SusD family nutrient uptake outer membrane protein [Bacteroidota bacterium]